MRLVFSFQRFKLVLHHSQLTQWKSYFRCFSSFTPTLPNSSTFSLTLPREAVCDSVSVKAVYYSERVTVCRIHSKPAKLLPNGSHVCLCLEMFLSFRICILTDLGPHYRHSNPATGLTNRRVHAKRQQQREERCDAAGEVLPFHPAAPLLTGAEGAASAAFLLLTCVHGPGE